MRRGPILDDLGHVAETAGWSATVGVPHRLGSRYFAVTRWLRGFSDHAFTDRVRAVRRCDAGLDNRLLALCSPREQDESQRTRNEDGERGRERPRFDEERCEGGEGSRGGNGEDHAQTMRRATSHLTALSRRVAPAPITDPATTCVVLTGSPQDVAA